MIDATQIQSQLESLLQVQDRPEAKRQAGELIEQLTNTFKLQQTKIDALLFELARMKNWRFGKSSESMDAVPGELEPKVAKELEQENKAEDRAADTARKATPKKQAKRQPLPSNLERIEHHYKIESGQCSQGHTLELMGQEISEQLDCVPARFFVHRHIRCKYNCKTCQTIVTAPMPAQVIDKGIPAPGLLAQVITAKHEDHLPLFRQEKIYQRSGVHIARASMASWVGQAGVALEPLAQALREHVFGQSVVHGDETPVKLLMPGEGKTKTAYDWAYRTSDLETNERAVVFDFCTSREGKHARRMLEQFEGVLLVDDYAGYKALFKNEHVIEAGCWAHVRRKFFEAHKHTQSAIAHEALIQIGKLYDIERELKEGEPAQRLQRRQKDSKELLDKFKLWLQEQRQKLADTGATAKAIDYTLGRWSALLVHVDNAQVPIDNNAVENAIRPIALGRKNWLFVGSSQAGERAATLMSLIESAKLNGHDAWAYLKDVLTKLPTWPNSRLEELLPHRWCAPSTENA